MYLQNASDFHQPITLIWASEKPHSAAKVALTNSKTVPFVLSRVKTACSKNQSQMLSKLSACYCLSISDWHTYIFPKRQKANKVNAAMVIISRCSHELIIEIVD